jgi:hypothetical protein
VGRVGQGRAGTNKDKGRSSKAEEIIPNSEKHGKTGTRGVGAVVRAAERRGQCCVRFVILDA